MSTYPHFPPGLKDRVSYGPYRALVERYRDADTVHLLVEAPFGVRVSVPIRVANVDAPKLSTEEGKAALAFAESVMPLGSYCLLYTDFEQNFERWIGTMALPEERDFGDVLVQAGHATYSDY